jgi:galactokinase
MIHPSELRPFFRSRFGEPRAFFAPGRVNFIGEHTDYNDGFVLPIALDLGITVLAAPRPDLRLHVTSHPPSGAAELEIDLNAPGPGRTGSWRDYVEGVAQALIAAGNEIGGADVLLASDLPTGAGLSSSAALEVSIGFALLTLARLPVDLARLALAGQAAEHHWVGTRCGIMDQLASARARHHNALFIDCRSLEVRDVPLPDSSLSILVVDTKVKHSLATSAYNTRREECERAVAILRGVLPEIRALRDVSANDLEEHQQKLPDPILRRARHVVTENERVKRAMTLLEGRRFDALGALLVESHRSLQHDYEVSCQELDALVDVAIQQKGVLGARMTGGGFGGSIVCLVETSALGRVESVLRETYARMFGQPPGFFVTCGGRGACEFP